MDNVVIRSEECCKTNYTNFCWTAIFAGAIVGVGLGFLLNLFGMAIGLSAYSSSANGANALAIGGVVGLIIGAVASMGAAGFVAGYLGRFHHCYCHGGIIYGFVTWGLALMLGAILVIPMTHYVSFYEDSINPSVNTTEVVATPSANTPVSTVQNTAPAVTPTAAKHMAWAGWILFALFFIGALSSCIGACYGMRCKREEIVHAHGHNPPVV